jgi:hypothetical protein
MLGFALPKAVAERVQNAGGQSGDVEIALIWNNENDLDLHCYDPTGSHIWWNTPRSPSGGFLDVDRNRQAPYEHEPVEHIRWDTNQQTRKAPPGRYRIYLDHFALHSSQDPTDYEVYIKYPGQTHPEQFRGQISYNPFRTRLTPGNERELIPITSFEVPSPDQIPVPAPVASADSSVGAMLYVALVNGLWTMLVAIGLSALLVVGQNRSMKLGWITPKQGAIVAVGAGLTGLVAGAAPQLLYGALPDQPIVQKIGQIAGWAALGGLLGLGVGQFIPNLAARRAALAGVAGGIAGALALLGMGESGLGRIVGAAVLGFAIGLMVALIEMFVREAWLVLHWGPKETNTVNLGATPVIIGSGQRSQVRLPRSWGIPDEYATISLANGRVEFQDKSSGKTTPLRDGSELRIQNLRIEVRTAK